ncbi:MAG: hypothetical protein OEW75_16510 [Cyclobacteriaceae bacterium]|nr:hypothetical protein [Cyclobacteriaceae bacterium]
MDYDFKIACEKDRFCKFVTDHGSYSHEEVHYLQNTILTKRLSRILYVSATLGIWSMLAAWVDLVVLPFIIIYTIALPGASYYPWLFPVVWTILNAIMKFFYIHQQLGDAVTLRDKVLAVFPYAGAAFLLKNWFVGDALLRGASLEYIKQQKKNMTNRLLSIFKK